MTAHPIDTIIKEINEIIEMGTKQIDAKTLVNVLEQVKKGSIDHFELEKQTREMIHASNLAEYNAQREGQRHLFNATITLAGHALKSAILINGGAAVSILTFIGHQSSNPSKLFFAHSLLFYVFGVFFASFATALSYYSQNHYTENRPSHGAFFRVCATIVVLISYYFFVQGSLTAYGGFLNFEKKRKRRHSFSGRSVRCIVA